MTGRDQEPGGVLPRVGREGETPGGHGGGVPGRGGHGERGGGAEHEAAVREVEDGEPGVAAQDERGDGVHVREPVVGGDPGAGAAVVEEHQAHPGALLDAPGHRLRHRLRPRHHLLAPRPHAPRRAGTHATAFSQ